MSFQDIVFQPLRYFSKHCGRSESPRTATCLETVVGGKQGHATCKILLLLQSLFLCHSKLMKILRLLQR